MPTGLLKITGLPLEMEKIECDVKIEDEKILALLKEPLKLKKKKTTQKDKAAAEAKPDAKAKDTPKADGAKTAKA